MKKLLFEKQDALEVLAKELLEKEILFQADLEKLIGKRPYEKETSYQAYINRRSNEEAAIHEEVVKQTLEQERKEQRPD